VPPSSPQARTDLLGLCGLVPSTTRRSEPTVRAFPRRKSYLETFDSTRLETFVFLRKVSETFSLPIKSLLEVAPFIFREDFMLSFAGYNEELLIRYNQWLVIQHYAPKTKRTYSRSIRLFVDYLGDTSLADVTHVEVRSYIAWLSDQGASLGGAYDHLQVLRRFYDFLNLGGVVT
jgi:hypothetical protein